MSKGTILVRHVPQMKEFVLLKVYGFQMDTATEQNKEDVSCALCSIETDDLEGKQALLADLLESYHIKNTDYYTCNEDLVIRLLESWKPHTEENVEKSTQPSKPVIPDGMYYLNRKVKGFGEISGTMEVKNGKYIVKAGSKCAPFSPKYKNVAVEKVRAKAVDTYNKVKIDIECSSVSGAAVLLIGNSANGNSEWKDESGKTIGELISNG